MLQKDEADHQHIVHDKQDDPQEIEIPDKSGHHNPGNGESTFDYGPK